MRRLGPTDLSSLAGAGRGCAAAVAATALMQWAKHAKTTNTPAHFVYALPALCLQASCAYAALGGNQEVLEWLHSSGCTWGTSTCWAAALGGHLNILQWAREHGCPWHWLTCASAAWSGHLRVLQWAREHHCPWNADTSLYAAQAGQLELLQWMRENDATGEAWDQGPRAPPRRWAQAAEGADVARPAQWSVNSLQHIQAACVRGTASAPREPMKATTRTEPMTRSIYTIFCRLHCTHDIICPGNLQPKGTRMWMMIGGG
jgi:hypothetical protein